MRVLGLDQSLTNYGWVLHDLRKAGAARSEARGRFRTKPREFADEVSRYVHLRSCIAELIERVQPDALGLEQPVFTWLGEDLRGHATDSRSRREEPVRR